MPYSKSVYVVVNKETFSVAPFSNIGAACKAITWLTGIRDTNLVKRVQRDLAESGDNKAHYAPTSTVHSNIVVAKREVYKDFK